MNGQVPCRHVCAALCLSHVLPIAPRLQAARAGWTQRRGQGRQRAPTGRRSAGEVRVGAG